MSPNMVREKNGVGLVKSGTDQRTSERKLVYERDAPAKKKRGGKGKTKISKYKRSPQRKVEGEKRDP